VPSKRRLTWNNAGDDQPGAGAGYAPAARACCGCAYLDGVVLDEYADMRPSVYGSIAAEAIRIVCPVDAGAMPLRRLDPELALILTGNDRLREALEIFPGNLFGLAEIGPYVGIAAVWQG
jgi:hypothetical protein